MKLKGCQLRGYKPAIGSFSNDDGDGNENLKNSNRFMEENNTFARASRFLYIYLPLLHDYDVKMPHFILLWRT